jgi:3-hydroxyacyl-CoA dehydrogenase
MKEINKVTVLGIGVLGSQIAYQTAYCDFDVVAYDIGEEALRLAKERVVNLAATYKEQVKGASIDKTDAALKRITYQMDLGLAVAQADLVIEAVPEKIELKQDIYSRIGKLAPAKAIFATNTSTLLPSDLMGYTGRPDRFLALHFANQIWIRNTAEVMGTGKVPIELKKEHPKYLLNSLLSPWLENALELVVDGVAEPETVDKTWRIATGAPMGPFQILDIVGLRTVYNIAAAGNDRQQRQARFLKKNYIDKGKLGPESGQGFYSYTSMK